LDDFRPLIPRQPVPPLDISVVGAGPWRLSDQKPEKFSLVVFYRGFHCPICSSYLTDIQQRLGALAERGVETIAVSSDGEERARMAVTKWALDKLKIGYGLTLANARQWGLFISTRRGPNPTPTGVVEPPLFSEPGLFLVQPDGTLYFASVQSMPFTRPSIGDVVRALDVVARENYPARGEVVDYPAAQAALGAADLPGL
jgi:alkyl hydroperoxide reductase subunit AhpC